MKLTDADVLDRLQAEAYQTAKDKGWHDQKRSAAEMLCLIHSEISECLEDLRDPNIEGMTAAGIGFKIEGKMIDPRGVYSDKQKPNSKPIGPAIEMADTVIRIWDLCASEGWDLSRALQIKMAYNKTRPHRHGGKNL